MRPATNNKMYRNPVRNTERKGETMEKFAMEIETGQETGQSARVMSYVLCMGTGLKSEEEIREGENQDGIS